MDTALEVGSALNSHLNQISSPGIEAVPVSKDGYKKISSLTLYVPERVDIGRILARQPPTFNYDRDCFIYILHLITSIPARKRDTIDASNGYTPINKKFLQRRIHQYKRYIEYLKHVDVIEERRSYTPGSVSMGLRFTSRFASRLAPVTITKWTLIKNIKYLNKNYNTGLTEQLEYLKEWFNDKIEVDYESGITFLNEIYEAESNNPEVKDAMLNYNSRLLPFTRMQNKDYSFYVDNTGFRLHTNLTQMLSGLRKFVKYQGKTLCALDIKNSQLYLAIALLDDEVFTNNNIASMITNPQLTSNTFYPIMIVEIIRSIKTEPDVLLFKEWVANGLFYENFESILIENGLLENNSGSNLRAIVKEITFSSIYSPNTSIAYSPSVQLFKEIFPNVFKIFKLIKRGHNNHPALAICLQRLEAELVLHKACKRISEERPEIFITTLHDSIITTEDNVEFVEMVLYNVLQTNIGVAPNLKRERWE